MLKLATKSAYLVLKNFKGRHPLDQKEKNMAVSYEKVAKKRPYEAIIIMAPEASEADQKTLFTKNKEIVEGLGGSVHSVETWGKRTLANQIDKTKLGVYFHSYFEAKPETILELERTMRINEKVLRCLHTRLDEKLPIAKHAENFKEILGESVKRQQEAEAKLAKKKAARSAQRGPRKYDGPRENRDNNSSRERG